MEEIVKSEKYDIIIVQGVGLKGKDGAEATLPADGEVGSLLEKTENGVRWTTQMTSHKIVGGTF